MKFLNKKHVCLKNAFYHKNGMWQLNHIASIKKVCLIEATYCIQIDMVQIKVALRTEMNKLAMRTQVLARCLTQKTKSFFNFQLISDRHFEITRKFSKLSEEI
jgi:hypothetical protein